MKTYIKNVKIIDGSQSKPFIGNILIENDKIKKIGNFAAEADEIIDGTGMCGGCRVQVGDETKFACVDGSEFDGLPFSLASTHRT